MSHWPINPRSRNTNKSQHKSSFSLIIQASQNYNSDTLGLTLTKCYHKILETAT